MGALSSAAKTAIQAGHPRYRQLWTIYVPTSSGASVYQSTVIHDDDTSVNDVSHVIAAGSREHFAYNVSLREPGRLHVCRYRFEVRNDDDKFFPAVASNYFYSSTGSYQAMPKECEVGHKVYVHTGSAWEELTPLQYRGRILSCGYSVRGSPEGYQGRSAIIICEALVAGILRRRWTEDDADDDDTTVNITLKA